ncbi:ATP-dependent carboxylate-amine ligase [Tropicimonas sp. TH_r6]|uniref:ATP-dependent carboxylate-amine ligase n=1 Tax=Tropicimonas sp. TH_r6 TaxID=3082085 RepID=UPI0029536083|nr:ATP-dependent carboxylate-amine ligase [Tropicimonas sp. TH_r6]MDV7144206.1 ATP-dependent carboxylate-amine ligase [Tropicimonas sp. TH_r6]
MLRLVPPDAALLARLPPFTALLAEAADRLDARLEMDAQFGFIGRLLTRDGRVLPIHGKSLGLNPDAAAQIAADKDYTARWLAAEGLSAPAGQLAFSPTYHARMALKNAETAGRLPGLDSAEAFALAQGYPVIVKPNSGSEGRDIHLCENRDALREALLRGFETDEILRVEPLIAGRDYRLLVLDGRLRLAYERRPLAVTGDGCSPLSLLMNNRLEDLARQHRGAKLLPDDPRILSCLTRAGLTPGTIPAAGARVPLLDNANLSTGGELVDLSGQLPSEVEALAIRAAACLGLTLAGIDILAPDLASGLSGAAILEVNSAPGLDYYAGASPKHHARAGEIVTEMLRLRLSRP